MTKDFRRFYVYAYLRSKDSERGVKYSPYYIGKGCRDRATSKCRTVPKPFDAAYIVYVQEGLTEEEAFSLEKYCIALYGRIDNGTGILRNRSDGGDGPTGVRRSDDARQNIANGKTKYKCELVDPGGNIHSVDNLHAFAKEMGLHYTMLTWLARGKKKKYKKWTCKSCVIVR
jgi:hypothetical protein